MEYGNDGLLRKLARMCQTIENKDKHQTKNTKHDDVPRTQTSEWNSRKRNMQSAYELRCLRHDVLYLCKWTESHTVKAKALAFQRRLVRSFRKVSHFSTKKKSKLNSYNSHGAAIYFCSVTLTAQYWLLSCWDSWPDESRYIFVQSSHDWNRSSQYIGRIEHNFPSERFIIFLTI